jgi:selenide, water dikinase
VRDFIDPGRVSELELVLPADAQTSGGLLVAGEIRGATVTGEFVAASGETTVRVR